MCCPPSAGFHVALPSPSCAPSAASPRTVGPAWPNHSVPVCVRNNAKALIPQRKQRVAMAWGWTMTAKPPQFWHRARSPCSRGQKSDDRDSQVREPPVSRPLPLVLHLSASAFFCLTLTSDLLVCSSVVRAPSTWARSCRASRFPPCWRHHRCRPVNYREKWMRPYRKAKATQAQIDRRDFIATAKLGWPRSVIDTSLSGH